MKTKALYKKIAQALQDQVFGDGAENSFNPLDESEVPDSWGSDASLEKEQSTTR